MEMRIGFGRRLGAYIIDIIFILGIGYILSSLYGNFLENYIDFSQISEEQLGQMHKFYGNFADVMLTFSISLPLAAFIYNIIEGFMGYTLGKLMLGMQIGNADGTSADIGKLMLRYVIKNISTLVGLIGIALMASTINTISSALGFVIIIGCFFALGEKKLALHDMLAKTAVFIKKDLENGDAATPMFAESSNN